MLSLKEQFINTDIKECDNMIAKIMIDIESKKARITSLLKKRKELIKQKEGI